MNVGGQQGSEMNVPKPQTPPTPPAKFNILTWVWWNLRCLLVCLLWISVWACAFSVRVKVRLHLLGLVFCVSVSVLVSVTGSGSYLNENFVIIYCLCCHLVSVPERNRRTENSKFRPVAEHEAEHRITQLNSTGDYGRRCKHLYARIIMFVFF